MLTRKLKKLVREPKLFLSDMIVKREKKIKEIITKKHKGAYQYTIVSAVYNVGRYLDEYFKSIVNQHIDFKNNIHIILVDDGSTDNSANIIKKWQRKYPLNISYIYKENGGQASARNLGLEYTNTEWVTFIDPDDFIDNEYFSSIDNFIFKNTEKNLKIVCCNLIFYFDATKKYKDSHPLKYRFAKEEIIAPINDLGKQIQLSASSAIFKTSNIKNNNITFDVEIKPNYEDAHFITKYLFPLDSGNAAFLKNAKYYYRKRSDGTSTLDNAWENPGLYSIVLQKGCIESMQRYLQSGRSIPESLQTQILYHVFWYLKRFINHEAKLSFLESEKIEEFEKNIHDIFSMIDEKIIMQFGLAGCWFYHKVGMLSCFKQSVPTYQIAYVEAYDKMKGLVQLRYFTGKYELENITVDDVDTIPVFIKNMKHEFLSKNFVNERRLWVKFELTSVIKINICGKPAIISLAGKQQKEGVSGEAIINHFETIKPKYDTSKKYKNAWILMDRDTHADDNAEHLYRYISVNHPDIKLFYVLRPTSRDWDRLVQDKFNLLDFGSEEHKSALESCSKVISSHADYCVTNLLGPKMLSGRHFIFLQHGVIKDDLSGWLNQKENIDCFITATKPEFDSIISDKSQYKFGKKEVVLSGLPRHDKLLKSIENNSNKKILIMPTWRSSIVGAPNKEGSERNINSLFIESCYAKHWYSLLHSPELHRICLKYNYEVIFSPHVNITPYLDEFEIPEFIKVESQEKKGIQNLFTEASLLVTDYSSVAFDMAVQSKSTIYYQFDEDTIFQGAHTYTKGYYNYREDGFGPVVTNECDFFTELDILLKNSAKPSNEIEKRISNTFKNRDGRNCERVFNAIEALDSPLPIDFIDIDILFEYATHASHSKDWNLAISRWAQVLNNGNEQQKCEAIVQNIISLNNLGKIRLALEAIDDNYGHNKLTWPIPVIREFARIQMKLQQWETATACWSMLADHNYEDAISFLQCTAELSNSARFESVHIRLNSITDEKYLLLSRAWNYICHSDWLNTIELLESNPIDFSLCEFSRLQINTILARCNRELGNYEVAREYLELASILLSDKSILNYENAKISFLENKLDKAAHQISNENVEPTSLSNDLIIIYLKGLRSQGKNAEAFDVIDKLPIEYFEDQIFLFEAGEVYYSLRKWKESVGVWSQLLNKYDIASYRLAHSYRMLGMIEEAMTLIENAKNTIPETIDEWVLRAELTQLCCKWDDAIHCWSSILHYYPDSAPQDTWSRLHHSQVMQVLSKSS
ncbi:glycosyltransferase [Yersinia mollaretii]|uniref:Glycosyltransferase n=1 Tax=Yersinia mollaretii TaxID=33060 RepID=A0AA44HZW7_YERMO|nr:CDP-glycerol glycerophosphotransferase family protein [Yersinia mollaretii]NIL22767.1 glycosyltransferase [Yersinia mollaretii]CNI68057.1 WbcK protein [Yersinia mollaretii]CQQ84674.1 WbcK protein [Yersinia mollaretii]